MELVGVDDFLQAPDIQIEAGHHVANVLRLQRFVRGSEVSRAKPFDVPVADVERRCRALRWNDGKPGLYRRDRRTDRCIGWGLARSSEERDRTEQWTQPAGTPR